MNGPLTVEIGISLCGVRRLTLANFSNLTNSHLLEGVVTIMPTRGYKFDASRMASYKFSLQAWDGGDPPRNSPPVKIHCIVVPQNRHSPVFKKKMYVGRVKQGEASSNIVQVN
jgi:hypothetical protein